MYKNIVLTDDIDSAYLQDVNQFIADWQSDDPVLTVFTSGSTGKPKEIFLKKTDIAFSARNTGKFFGFKAGQTLLLNLSPHYIAGKLMIVRALLFEMNIYIAPNVENPLLALPATATIDFAAFVPYQVKAILNNPKSRAIYEQISAVIIGGAPLAISERNVLSRFKNKSYCTFGMTETITHFALNKIQAANDIYECLPGFTIQQDARGCLVLDANKMLPDPLITTDLIELISDTKFKWKGRLDYVINSGGIKLHPEELEYVLKSAGMNERFYFTKRLSEKFGEELILVIEGVEEITIMNEFERIMANWERYKIPKSILFIAKFEETSSGKIKRKTF